MKVNKRNYYSKKANFEYLSVSQYKDFCGTMGKGGCEAMALAKLRGEWETEPTTPMLVGSYVDSYFEGSLDKFKEENSNIFKKDGTLKSEYEKAEQIIKVAESDKFFMDFMAGKKQKIMTAELFGAKWKIKIDSYHKNKCIVDLKVVKDIHERFWVKDFGFTNFIDYWGYDLQGAIYQAVVYKNTGKLLPFFIAAIDKTNTPDKAVISVDNSHLKSALTEIENNTTRILMLKEGKVEPDRCEKCDYCKSTKKLNKIIHFSELIEY